MPPKQTKKKKVGKRKKRNGGSIWTNKRPSMSVKRSPKRLSPVQLSSPIRIASDSRKAAVAVSGNMMRIDPLHFLSGSFRNNKTLTKP